MLTVSLMYLELLLLICSILILTSLSFSGFYGLQGSQRQGKGAFYFCAVAAADVMGRK